MSGLDADGLDVLAACVEANVRSLAWTNERLHESERALTLSVGQALLDLYDGLCKIPEMQRSVYIERLIFMAGPAVNQVDQLMSRDVA